MWQSEGGQVNISVFPERLAGAQLWRGADPILNKKPIKINTSPNVNCVWDTEGSNEDINK